LLKAKYDTSRLEIALMPTYRRSERKKLTVRPMKIPMSRVSQENFLMIFLTDLG
jgi:hypothetical protein